LSKSDREAIERLRLFLHDVMTIENPCNNILARFKLNCLSNYSSFDYAKNIIEQSLNKAFFTRINNAIETHVEEIDEKK
jgi:hypothetical protein